MRPTFHVQGHTVREITLWKAIVYGILTIGIYLLIVTYQNSQDLHLATGRDNGIMVLLFIIGIFLSPVMIVLWAFNGMAFQELREKGGLPPDSTWIVALVLGTVLPPVGQIVWTVHFNNQLQALATPAA